MDSFFGIGIAELFFIALIALIVLGPERLPGAIREVSKYARYVRNLSSELTSQFSEEMKAFDDINPQKLMKELTGELEAEQKKPKPAAKSTSKPAAKKSVVKPAAAATTVAATKKATTKKATTTDASVARDSKQQDSEPAKPDGADAAKVNSDGADSAAELEAENRIMPPATADKEKSDESAVSAPVVESGTSRQGSPGVQDSVNREETVTGANPPQSSMPVEDHNDSVIESAPAANQPTVSVNGKPAPAEGDG